MIRTDRKPAAPARKLGALSWVLGDLSQSLPLAALSLQRAAREASSTGPFSTESPDHSNLHSASRQIRQAAGALAIIGYTEVAKVLSAAETASDFFLRMPHACTEESVATVNRACIAVLNFLQANMGGYIGSPVALYPCYRELTKIFSAQHCHPADLWPHTWHEHILAPEAGDGRASPGLQTTKTTAAFDQALLGCIRDGDSPSAGLASRLCGDLSSTQEDPRRARYWYAAAAFFEAIRLRLLVLTSEVKRSMADIRSQFLIQGEAAAPGLERRTRELVFFCACANVPTGETAIWLRQVRYTYGLESEPHLDYTSDFFSRRDHQQLAVARRRHEMLTQSWNALVGGQNSQLSQVRAQFSLLSDVLTALEPKSSGLLLVVDAYLDDLQRTGAVPSAAMAMEIAFALLALEAVCALLLPAPKMFEHQFNALVKRLVSTRETHRHIPLEDWMTHTLRRSTVGSAMNKMTAALHTELRQIELDLEHYFGESREIVSLGDACIRLAQLSGVFTVLDIPQAHLATKHVRAQINALLKEAPSQTSSIRQAPVSWATNLGNLAVLADVLAYQPTLAQQAFHFDPAVGELVFQQFANPVASDTTASPSRSKVSVPWQHAADAMPPMGTPHHDTAAVGTGAQSSPPEPAESSEELILAIFLTEARVVIAQARQVITQTAHAVDGHAQEQDLHAIRRAFHTLKGGARMVGLRDVGEAAWAFEQLFNAHLVQSRNTLADVLAASDEALACLQEWADAISNGLPAPYSDAKFRQTADALRLNRNYQALRPDHRAAESPLVSGPSRTSDPSPALGELGLSASLLQVFTTEASERIELLRHALGKWKIETDSTHQHAIRDLAHALHGSAATVRCSGLAALARALESCFQSLAPDAVMTTDRQQTLQDCMAELKNLLQRFIEGHVDEPKVGLLAELQGLAEKASGAALDRGDLSLAQATPLQLTQHQSEPEHDQLDPELWPVFQEEAHALLEALGLALDDWASQPDGESQIGQVRRLLHTLKGSARLAGAMHIGALTHDLESYLSEIPDGKATAADISTARETLDAIQIHFNQHQPNAEMGVQKIQETPGVGPTLQQVQGILRVRANAVDRLLDQSGEVLLIRSRMQSRAADLLGALDAMAHNAARLREQLRELEMQSELQMQSRSSTPQNDASVLDPLELDRFTRLQEITRMMAESHDDLGTVQKALRTGLSALERDLALQGRQARAMHHDVLSMRRIAFDDMAGRLYAVVRQAAKDVGVSVRLDISGSTTKLERGLFNRIAPCLEHLLRNAVVHGIEPPAVRIASGKPAPGLISMSVEQSGQETRIEVRDDGAGLHIDRIRAKAIEKSLLPQHAELHVDDALALMLQPGFSTSDDITLLSGRGVGMDVVQSEVQALGGYLTIHHESGKGMRFSMIFPLTNTLTQIALFRVGNTLFGLPNHIVTQVSERPRAMAQGLGDGRSFVDLADHGRVELFWAGDLLEGPGPAADPALESFATVVCSSAGRSVALQVDEALGEREITLKNLGPQLSGVPALIAAGVLPSGELLLIYNPAALVAVHGEVARSRQAARAARGHSDSTGPHYRGSAGPAVLVVDDSITMRRVMERLLLREGMRVLLAGNGQEALEQLKTIHPAVILSDIEMPRMDGFDLIRRIRADARTADIPIVVISSRVAQKHQNIAAELGANHYLGKPFNEAELLALVRLYCGEKSTA